MSWNDGIATFTANGALSAKVRVKLTAASATVPPQVEVAGAAEQHIGITEYAAATGTPVAVKLRTAPGIHEGIASEVLAVGAVLYAAAAGKVKDTSDGTAIGIAVDAATADGDIIRFIDFTTISTTAATISIADAGNIITGATVEAALAEIMVGMKTAQYTIAPCAIRLETGAAVAAFANAGADGWAQLGNKELAIRWNNGANPTKIAFVYVLPQDLNDAADAIVHFVGAIVKAGGDEADSPTLTVEAYFQSVGADPSADTDCGGTSGEFLTTADANYQEKTLTLALADVPAAPTILTLIVNPTDGQLGTDDFVLQPPWLEITRKCLTS